MATIARLNVLLGLTTAPFQAGLRTAKSALHSFHVEAANVFTRVGPFSIRMGPAAAGLFALAGGIKSVAVEAVSTAAKFEQMEIAFTGMLGSADKAKSVLDDLFQFAATTPFTFEGVTQATQRLLAFGFSAENAVGIVKQMADVAAAMPEGIDEGLKRVTRAIGEMQAKGRVSAQEMRQLADAGIPVWDALAQRIGVSVPKAMKMAENNILSARDGIMALLDLANSPRFTGMSQRLGQSMLGLWSTFKDNVQLTMRDLGNALIKGFDLKGATTTLTDLFGFLRSQIGALTPAIEKIGTVFRTVFEVIVSMVKLAVQAFAGWTATIDNSPAGLQKLRADVLATMRKITMAVVEGATAIANAFIDLSNAVGGVSGALRQLGRIYYGLAAGFNLVEGAVQGFNNAIGLGSLNRPGNAERLAELQKNFEALGGSSTPAAKLSSAGVVGKINELFTTLSVGGPIFQQAANKATVFGLALGGAASQAQSLVLPLNGLPKAVTDAVSAARGPLQQFKDQIRETARLIEKSLPGAFMTAADAAGIALGGMGMHLLESQRAVRALRLLDAQRLLDFEKDNPLLNRGDVGAMQKGSAEAASAINRAFNETRRQERDPQQRAAAILEQMNKRDAEKKRLLEEMAQALEALGVQ